MLFWLGKGVPSAVNYIVLSKANVAVFWLAVAVAV